MLFPVFKLWKNRETLTSERGAADVEIETPKALREGGLRLINKHNPRCPQVRCLLPQPTTRCFI